MSWTLMKITLQAYVLASAIARAASPRLEGLTKRFYIAPDHLYDATKPHHTTCAAGGCCRPELQRAGTAANRPAM